MKWAVAAVATVAAVLAGAASAAAAERSRVSAKAVTLSRASVTAYWTPARMRRAIPAGPATAAAPATTAAAAAEEYPGDPAAPPASAHGKVFFTSHGADYVCSGTAIRSQNRSVVWTAGHCVNDGPGAFHTNWAFVPGYRDGGRPLGTWTARRLLTTDAWRTGGDLGYDFGAAVVSAATDGTALTDRAGGRSITFNGSRNLTVSAFGYPSLPPFSGGRLWLCRSPVIGQDASISPPTMAISCDMGSGASGGGWVAGDTVVSVTSYSYANRPDVVYAPYQGPEAAALFAAAAAG